MTSTALLLATIPSPTRAVWHLGPFPIRAYAICIILGIFAACWIAERRLRQRGAPRWFVLDIAIWAVPFGIVGGRIYHVISDWPTYFGDGPKTPLHALRIWDGGLGIWGAIAFGAVGALIACRRAGIPLTFFADVVAPALPVAQAIGRIGNWFNNELYGGPTSLPWGLTVYKMNLSTGQVLVEGGQPELAEPGPVHPTFLYELIWDLGVAGLVLWAERKWKLGKGRAFMLYVAAYCSGRLWIEAMRTDDARIILGQRVNIWVSLLVLAVALIYLFRVRGPQEHVSIVDGARMQVVTADGTPIEWSRVEVRLKQWWAKQRSSDGGGGPEDSGGAAAAQPQRGSAGRGAGPEK